MTGRQRGVAGVLGGAALFATAGTARAVLAPGAWPPSVAAVRLLVGAAGLVAFVLVTRGSRDLSAALRQPVTWAMGVGVAGYQAFFFLGVAQAGVAVGTVVALGCAPLMAGILGWLVGEGAPGWAWLAGTVLAVTGLALLTLSPTGAPTSLTGIAAAVAAGASYSVYTVLGVRVAREGLTPSVIMAAPFTLAALLCLPCAPAASAWVGNPGGLVLALWLGLGATAAAYLLFSLGLPVLPPGHISTLTLLEPVGATLLGVVVLGERLSPAGWAGCALVLLGLVAVALPTPTVRARRVVPSS